MVNSEIDQILQNKAILRNKQFDICVILIKLCYFKTDY